MKDENISTVQQSKILSALRSVNLQLSLNNVILATLWRVLARCISPLISATKLYNFEKKLQNNYKKFTTIY